MPTLSDLATVLATEKGGVLMSRVGFRREWSFLTL
jgi:hypothetical protein